MTRASALAVAAGVAGLLGAAVPARAGAQESRWEREVRAKLERAVEAIGAPRTAPLRVGNLNGEESAAVGVHLDAGVRYSIVAVCDDDCSMLQLVLATATHSELAVDRHSENLPVLRFTPRVSGTYRIRVVMERCRMNPCWYGVGLATLPN